MYAVIRSGGKQHRVEPGQVVKVERLEGEVGAKVELKEVLLVEKDGEIKIGAPLVSRAKIQTTVVAQDRHSKIIVFKKKRKKQYRRTNGHRQAYTALRVDAIKG
jgi:large subunit ribosomal protein L21